MLEFNKRNLVEMPFEVLEQAYWRPREIQLCCKYKPEDKSEVEFIRLRKLWRQREVFFNFSLDTLLMSLNPNELSLFAESLSFSPFKSTFLFSGYCQELKRIIGVPDFILSDEYSCILGEIKISAKYALTQFIKYQSFALLGKALSYLPENFSHVIVAQTVEPRDFLLDYGKTWLPNMQNGQLKLQQEEQDVVAKAMKINSLNIIKKLRSSRNNFYLDNLNLEILEKQSKNIIPTFVLSWKDFVEKFNNSTKRADLFTASNSLLNLGMSKIELETSH